MKAVRFHSHGGPEVLRLEDIPAPVPQPGEALVRVGSAGVNHADIYRRTGVTATALPPITGRLHRQRSMVFPGYHLWTH